MDSAFNNMTSLKEVMIPDGWSDIGYEDQENVFAFCTSLQKVTIGANVKSICPGAFKHCTALEKVIFKGNDESLLESIGYSAFSECSKLKDIVLPNGVKTIGEEAFEECIALEVITIPSSVTFIGAHAFVGCSKVDKVYIQDGTMPLENGGDAFSSLRPSYLYLGRDITYDSPYEAPEKGFLYDRPLKILEIGNTITRVPWDFGEALTDVFSWSYTPENVSVNFSNKVYANAKLHVPHGMVNTYSNAPVWRNFFFIDEFSNSTNIDFKLKSNTKTFIYNLQGLQVGKLQRGVNIVRTSDGKIYKIVNQ